MSAAVGLIASRMSRALRGAGRRTVDDVAGQGGIPSAREVRPAAGRAELSDQGALSISAQRWAQGAYR